MKKSFHLFVLLVVLTALMAGNSAAVSVKAQTPAATAQAVDTKGWPETFILGLFQSDDAAKAIAGAEPVRAYLEKTIKQQLPSFRVVVYTGTSYTAVIEAMKAGRIDAFEVGPFAYILAAQEANAEALGIGVPESGGAKVYDPNYKPYYLSTIITKKGSGIKTIADLKGKSFSFVDPASTSGHLMPASIIMKAGLNPDTDLKPIYAGSHPASVLAVMNDKVAAGATYVGNLIQQIKDNHADVCFFADGDQQKARTQKEFDDLYASCKDGQLVPIALSDPIPSTPLAINRNLPQSFRDAVKAALMHIKDDPAAVQAIGKWYVDPSKDNGLDSLDAFYNPLRETAKILNLNLKAIVK